MLVFDPNEVFFRNMGNDGGSRLVQKNPADCRELTSRAIHYYGKKLFCAFLPSASENKFSIYSANLAGAYSAKIKNLVRTFCFVNYNDPQRPAVAVVYDRLEKSDANFKSFWQITTLVKPEITEQGVRLTSYRRNKGKTGKLDLWMYKPTLKECKLEILSGKDSCNVFGKQYIAPAQGLPEAQGSRVMFSPRKNAAEQEFLAIMDIYGSEASPRKAVVLENNSCFVVAADNQVVVLPRNSRLQQQSFSFKLPESSGKRSIAVANLAAGLWQIKTNKNKILQLEAVQGIHTLYIESADSAFELSPVSDK